LSPSFLVSTAKLCVVVLCSGCVCVSVSVR
jgi:hypothetical protein